MNSPALSWLIFVLWNLVCSSTAGLEWCVSTDSSSPGDGDLHALVFCISHTTMIWLEPLFKAKVSRIRLSTPRKVNKSGCAPKGSWWHHNPANFFRLVRQCMGLMTSQPCHFRARSILWGFVVPKLIFLFTREGWSAQPYSINFA